MTTTRPLTNRLPWLAAVLGVLLVSGVLVAQRSAAQAQNVPIASGSLEWGVKASFRSYIEGPIAEGSIEVSEGASVNDDGTFHFSPASGAYDTQTHAFTATFGGAVEFLGHDYGNGALLRVKISNLRIENAGDEFALIADVESLALESLDPAAEPGDPELFEGVVLAAITAGPPSVDGLTVTYEDLPAELTAEGVEPFAEFYPAATPLDPVSFTVTLQQAEPTATATATTTTAATATATTATTSPTAAATATSTATTVPATATATATTAQPTATNTTQPTTAPATATATRTSVAPSPPNSGTGTGGGDSTAMIVIAIGVVLAAAGAGTGLAVVRRRGS